MLSFFKKLHFLLLFLLTLLYCVFIAISAKYGHEQITHVVFATLFTASILFIANDERHILLWVSILWIVKLMQVAASLWIINSELNELKAFLAMSGFLLMTIACLKLTVKEQTISITTLFGSLSAYLFIGLSFAYFFIMVDLIYPSTFYGLRPYEETRAIYYSFVTLTSVGFGDIVSKDPIIQTVTWIEAFCGQAYMVMFISLLVGRYITDRMNSTLK